MCIRSGKEFGLGHILDKNLDSFGFLSELAKMVKYQTGLAHIYINASKIISGRLYLWESGKF